MTTTTSSGTSGTSGTALHRELKVTDAAAFSIGLIGPVGVMALLGAGAAGILGRGATWAFVFALVAVSLVAYGFVKLSRYIAHTGSVYALVGLTLGPRAGFVAGWMLFLAYFTIGAGSTIEIGLFLTQLLQDLGIGFAPDWLIVAVVALVVVLVVSRSQVHVITRVLLFAELIGAGLVTILNLVVLVRLGTGTAPAGRGLSFSFLSLPAGTDIGTIGAAAVFGFLAFAGFEGAATLGEETSSPKRDIPRALKIAVAVVGAFYLLSIVAQTLGYGTTDADVKRFTGAAAPYGDLGRAYVGPWLADLLTLFAVVSLFAISIGTLSGASRVLYALSRGAGVKGGVARLSSNGVPTRALLVSGGLALVCMVVEPAGRLRAGHRRRDPVPLLRRPHPHAEVADRDPDPGRAAAALHAVQERRRGRGRLRPVPVLRARLADRGRAHLVPARPDAAGRGGPGRRRLGGDRPVTRIAAVQLAPVLGDPAGNVDRAVQAVEAAVAEGAQVVVLPELATSGYVFQSVEEVRASAIGLDAEAFDRLAAAAGEAVVVVGFAEEDGEAVRNSAALLDASGVRAVYRKVHLWDQEKRFFVPGDAAPPVVETAYGRIGVMICFDMEFPEWTRIAALRGADLLAVPTNWPGGPLLAGQQAPEVQIAIGTARANKMAIACADRTGDERGVRWTEGTTIVDALGGVRSVVGPGSGTAWADLDLLDSRDKRQGELVDLLGDRRPDLYGPLLE